MDHRGKFFKGFLLGLLLMALVSAGGFYTYTTAGQSKVGGTLTNKENLDKISYLEGLIDMYYLNDVNTEELQAK